MKKQDLFAIMVIGKQTPSKIYTDYFEAQEEAMRLVKQERQPAYVLKAVALVELQEVTITRLDFDTK
jgi:hypothetical protein